MMGVKERGPSMSYAGFHYFRMHLMHLCGYEGDDYGEGLEVVKTKDPDLYPFLNHCDCEGSWDSEECEMIAKALRAYSGKVDDSMRDVLDSFIDLFKKASFDCFNRVEIF